MIYMLAVVDWLRIHWLHVVWPLLAFLAAYVVGLWLRRLLRKYLQRLGETGKWEGYVIVWQVIKTQVLVWFLLLGTYIATYISIIDRSLKSLIGKIIIALFIVSVTWVIARFVEKLLRLYLAKEERLKPSEPLIVNIARITVGVVGALVLLDFLGAPTTPLVVLLAVAVLVAALAFRNVLANLLSGFQLVQSEHIKVGDFVRLESGESGYVADINWRNTQIKALDGNVILVPNNRLLQGTVINYGHPLKQACEPFRFYSRLNLKELTGLKARNLAELAKGLREVPGSVIYYHTHNFLEEHHYLTPEPANDFALWISDALGNEALGERVASIDTFDFSTIGALRTRIVGVIEEYLSKKNDNKRTAPEGREFHFIKSISVIIPTAYIAHDLREFVEVLRKISTNSLYYHMFDSKLRLQKGVNDFSTWVTDCVGDSDLGERLAYLDPYNYTMENLRSTIIQLIEKRIK